MKDLHDFTTRNVTKATFAVVGFVVALAFILAGLRNIRGDMELEINLLRQLNDSTTAALAKERLDKKEMAGLLTAARDLNANLVAGVRLLIAKRDTNIVHDTLPTVVKPDSTRVATFRDSTFAGIVEGTMTAPPCCAALELSYTLTRPQFSPSIGFVQRGDQVAAVVTWQGEKVEAMSAFAKIPVKEPRLRPFVETGVSTLLTVRGAAGVDVRLTSQWSIAASVQQDVPTNGDPLRGPQAWVFMRRKW